MSTHGLPEEHEAHKKMLKTIQGFRDAPCSPNEFQCRFAGVKAFLEGKTLDDCPFTTDQDEFYPWANGYESARHEYKKRDLWDGNPVLVKRCPSCGQDTDGTLLSPPPCSPSACRKADGWAPTLEYTNGGRVIGQQRCGSMEEAVDESRQMIQCMTDYPVSFRNNHPAPNQLIDLGANAEVDGP